MPMALAVGALAMTAASTAYQVSSANSAKKDAARAAGEAMATNDAVTAFNARVDRAEERQVDLNSIANIRAMRKDARTYLSRQEAAYAGSGVRADTGSPVAVRAATAGALALREQQAQTDTVARMEKLESSAKAGIAEGAAQTEAIRIQGQPTADAYRREATGAVLSGAAKMLSMGAMMYGGGAFGGGKVGLDVPAATPANTGGFDSPTWAGGFA